MNGTGAVSASDIQPLPADLNLLPAPQMAPPITRTAPADVKYDLTTQKVTAQMADGVAYEYWTFNGTVPGPMLRVREGDMVEIDLHNAADAGVTHSIDLHAVSGPGGGAKVMQVTPCEDGSFKFQALSPGVYILRILALLLLMAFTVLMVDPRLRGLFELAPFRPGDPMMALVATGWSLLLRWTWRGSCSAGCLARTPQVGSDAKPPSMSTLRCSAPGAPPQIGRLW